MKRCPCPEQGEEESNLAKRAIHSEGVGEESSIRKVLPPKRGEARPIGERPMCSGLW